MKQAFIQESTDWTDSDPAVAVTNLKLEKATNSTDQ